MELKVTSRIRREIIQATGLCLNPECTAHDSVVARIWKYKSQAEVKAFQEGRYSALDGEE